MPQTFWMEVKTLEMTTIHQYLSTDIYLLVSSTIAKGSRPPPQEADRFAACLRANPSLAAALDTIALWRGLNTVTSRRASFPPDHCTRRAISLSKDNISADNICHCERNHGR